MARIPRTDIDVLPLVLGGNTFGWTSDEQASFAVLDAFVAAGGTAIDTADGYSAWVPGNSGGESETILGAWMEARGNRDEVVLATKVASKPDRQGLSRENVLAALDESLQRLRTDHVDLYYFHFDDENVSIEDQVATAREVLDSGKARHLALSNYSPERLRAFLETAREQGVTLPVAHQPQYNLLHRAQFEQEFAPIAAEFELATFPYYALASGVLTGKYRTAADAEGAPRGGAATELLGRPGTPAVLEALHAVAEAHGVEVTSVSLAWLRAKGVAAPIASASRPEQVAALIAGATLELSAAEVAALDDASQPFA